MDRLPLIDVSCLWSDDPSVGTADQVRAIAVEIDRACREVGFFTITGHRVRDGLLAELDAASREFFAQPDDIKAAVAMEHGGAAWRGWFPVGGELTSGRPDRKEGLYVGAELAPTHPAVLAGTPLHGPNLLPAEPPDLAPLVLEWVDTMTALAHRVMRGIALGLGMPLTWFEDTLTADPTVLFRIFHYPPAPADDDGWGVGEHTDYGLLTLLAQDDCGGLQVQSRTGWIEVPAQPDVLVCNIGDMLDRLTAGRYRSTPHRVRNTSGRGRLSFPFFFDPSWTATVPTLPLDGSPPSDDRHHRWDGASVHDWTGTYGDYLTAKVAKVFPTLIRSVASPLRSPGGDPLG